jgi:hypothetical protein
MANNIELSVPLRKLGHSDIEFQVKRIGTVLVALKVSPKPKPAKPGA